MTWTLAIAIYTAGFVLIPVITWVSLRSEPTAHGQIVGQQLGCAFAVVWPLVLAYFVIISPFVLGRWVYCKATGREFGA